MRPSAERQNAAAPNIWDDPRLTPLSARLLDMNGEGGLAFWKLGKY